MVPVTGKKPNYTCGWGASNIICNLMKNQPANPTKYFGMNKEKRKTHTGK